MEKRKRVSTAKAERRRVENIVHPVRNVRQQQVLALRSLIATIQTRVSKCSESFQVDQPQGGLTLRGNAQPPTSPLSPVALPLPTASCGVLSAYAQASAVW